MKAWRVRKKNVPLHKVISIISLMCTIVDQKTTHIKTQDGVTLARRVTTVRMPNGKFRHPVVYFDLTPDVVRVTRSELERLRVPGYKQLI